VERALPAKMKTKINTNRLIRMVELLKVPSRSKTEPFTLASGSLRCVMVKVLSSGQTAANMKANGRVTKQMARANWCMLTAMSMKENGLTTKLRVMEPIATPMVPSTRDRGSTISSTAKVLSHGLMVHATKANTSKERRKVMVV